MNAFRRWLRQWDWKKIGVWVLVIIFCLTVWYFFSKLVWGAWDAIFH